MLLLSKVSTVCPVYEVWRKATTTHLLSTLNICSLFLSGAGAGAALLLFALDLLSPQACGAGHHYSPRPEYRSFFMPGFALTMLTLLLTAFCFIFDLGKSERVLLLYTHPTFSFITLGTYALTVLIVCVGLLALLWSFMLPPFLRIIVRCVELLGLVASLTVMLYTGLLFYQIGNGILLGSVLVPMLFLFSSLSSGIALLLGIAFFNEAVADIFWLTFKRLIRLDMIIIVVEMVCVAALFLQAFREQVPAQSAKALLFGSYAEVFWCGFIVIGFTIPLILECTSMVRRASPGQAVLYRKKHTAHRNPRIRLGRVALNTRITRMALPHSCLAFIAVSVLIGAFCLRWTILEAGLPVFFKTSTLLTLLDSLISVGI